MEWKGVSFLSLTAMILWLRSRAGLIFFCVLLLFMQTSFAQSYNHDTGKPIKKKSTVKNKQKEKQFLPDVIKLNLTGLVLKGIGVQYERRVRRKLSLAIGVIYRPMGIWPIARLYDSSSQTTINFSLETKFMYGSSKYRSLMLTPELRYYLGRHAPRGLYLAPFVRLAVDRTRFRFHYYEDNTGIQKLGTGYLNETSIGAGVLFGYQLITRRKWGIDFWFIGPWIGSDQANLKSSLPADKISDLQQKFISQDMKSFINNATDVTWNSQGIATSFHQLFIGCRLIGINFARNF